MPPVNAEDLDQLLTIEQAANMLGMNPKVMKRTIIKDREIDVITITARNVRITRRAVIDYLNKRTIRARSKVAS